MRHARPRKFSRPCLRLLGHICNNDNNLFHVDVKNRVNTSSVFTSTYVTLTAIPTWGHPRVGQP